MSLALLICILLIWLMQLVNGAQFLNITFSLVLFTAASAAAVLLTLIVPLDFVRLFSSSRRSDRVYLG